MDRHPLYALALPLISIGAVGQVAGWLAHWMYPAIGAILVSKLANRASRTAHN